MMSRNRFETQTEDFGLHFMIDVDVSNAGWSSQIEKLVGWIQRLDAITDPDALFEDRLYTRIQAAKEFSLNRSFRAKSVTMQVVWSLENERAYRALIALAVKRLGEDFPGTPDDAPIRVSMADYLIEEFLASYDFDGTHGFRGIKRSALLSKKKMAGRRRVVPSKAH